MALPERELAFLRSVLAASEDCIKVIGLDGRLTYMSDGGMRIMEIDDFDDVKGCPWPDFWKDAGNADARAALEAARERRSYRFQGAADTFLGNPRYWDVQVSPILDEDGAPEAILSVSRDITRMKATEDRTRLLAQELEHRVKNIVALIQSIVNQSFLPDITVADARDRLAGRLAALGSAHDLLMQVAWHSASLGELVTATMEMHGASRFSCEGPPVRLSSKAALAMALALHELATNAIKYGALSNDTGHIHIAWHIEDGIFRLDWTESGGPKIRAPEKTGFGTRMIAKALASYINGKGEVDYAEDGLRFRLAAPFDDLADG